MKIRIAIAFCFFLPLIAAAKKDPAIDARKEYVLNYRKALEQLGYGSEVYVTVAGKDHDVLQILLVRFGVSGVISFEKQRVEPIRDDIKAQGFRLIELKTDAYSETFPKGIWQLPLN